MDDDGIREHDWEIKMRSKDREDKNRGAKNSDIQVGDIVVVARHMRAKGDAPFAGKEFKVTRKRRGDLELIANDGQKLERNVTQVRKLFKRMQAMDEISTPDTENESTLEVSKKKSKRLTAKPKRFEDYVMSLFMK